MGQHNPRRSIISAPRNLQELPEDLPVPLDDGACRHLPGSPVPSISLASTAGRLVDLANLTGRTVVYGYPRTGRPNEPLPTGWDAIPGARGCTPEACGFRDHAPQLCDLGVDALFGLSTQDSAYQREVVERLGLPFELLSDEHLALTRALRLPTFDVDGMVLIKRLTLVLRDSQIEHVFYPVFPPDWDAEQVSDWLAGHAAARDA